MGFVHLEVLIDTSEPSSRKQTNKHQLWSQLSRTVPLTSTPCYFAYLCFIMLPVSFFKVLHYLISKLFSLWPYLINKVKKKKRGFRKIRKKPAYIYLAQVSQVHRITEIQSGLGYKGPQRSSNSNLSATRRAANLKKFTSL